MRSFNFLLLTALCISGPATATEIKLLTDDGDKPATHILEQKDGTYEYYAAIGEIADSLTLDPETAAIVTRIEYNATTSWAVGEDGPWWPVPSSSTAPVWHDIPLSTLTAGTLPVPADDKIPETKGLSQDTIKAAQVTLKADPDINDPDRWITLLNKCDGSDASPCYSYMSERTFRYTLKSGAVIPVTIHYPGGC